MRWVATPASRPHHCAAVPFIARDEEGFIDTGSELPGYDNHVYVSVKAVREMARMVGMVGQGEYRAALERVVTLEAQLKDAAEENDALRNQFEAIDTLRKVGLVPVKETA
jgi:hypothetical protein